MRAILRFLGFLAVVAGFIAMVIDMTGYFANGVWRLTTLAQALDGLIADGAGRLVQAASGLPGGVVGALAGMVLSWPASLTGLVAGFGVMWLFRREEPAA